MRFISTKTHGYLDYVIGLALIVAPWALGFARGGAETWVPVLLGASTLLYSVYTRYELGIIKALPMSAHLMLDLMSGILLATSPWLFNFADVVTTPHVVVGLLEIGAALTTQTEPAWDRAAAKPRT